MNTHACLHACFKALLHWMNGWTNEWMDGWMDEWLNETMICEYMRYSHMGIYTYGYTHGLMNEICGESCRFRGGRGIRIYRVFRRQEAGSR